MKIEKKGDLYIAKWGVYCGVGSKASIAIEECFKDYSVTQGIKEGVLLSPYYQRRG